jgi:hypothetical protein
MQSNIPNLPNQVVDAVDGRVSQRRTFLKVLAAAGVVALNPVAAFAATKTTKRKKTTKKRTAPATTPTSVATKSPAAPAAAPASGSASAASPNEAVIGFTYVPSNSGRRIHNPYIAVWIETADGQPIRTVALQFQPGKGERWLPDLKRWYQADQARLSGPLDGVDIVGTVSAATKLPGTQRFVWDGLDDSKAPVPAGDYVLFIEAAREKGPYQLVREPITLNSADSRKIADNGDLQSITLDVRAKS